MLTQIKWMATLAFLFAHGRAAATPLGSPTPTATPTPLPYSLALDVYNSAGEPTAQLYRGACDAVPSALTINPSAFVPGPPGVAVELSGCTLAPAGPIGWDGSVSGVWASPGSYYVQALVTDAYGGQTVMVASVAVLASPTPSVTVTGTASPSPTTTPTASPSATPAYRVSPLDHSVLGPSPLRGHQPLCLAFERAPASSHWQVHSLDGAKVAELRFGSQRDQCWDPTGVASGIYLVHLDIVHTDGSREQRWQKVALLR